MAGGAAWADMIPLGGGFLGVQNPHFVGLPQSMPVDPNDPDGVQVYGTAVIHQVYDSFEIAQLRVDADYTR